MYDGLAGRGLVRDVRGLAEAIAPSAPPAPRPGHEDRAAASTVRPTDASPAAIVRLSSDGMEAVERLRAHSHSEQGLDGELSERDTADAPEVSKKPGTYKAGPDPPEHPAMPLPDRPPATTSDALSRYLQVTRDPTAALSVFEDPRATV